MLNVRHSLVLFVCTIALFGQVHGVVSTLQNNDPDPLYYTHTPHDYLSAQLKRQLRQPCIDQPCYDEQRCYDHFLFSIGAFHQKATRGRNFERERVRLGDIAGRWDMLALLYGQIPEGQTLNDTLLGYAKTQIFPPATPNTIITGIEAIVDPKMLAGFFSVPIKYHKTGARFALEFGLLGSSDVGIGIYGGAAELKQTATTFFDLTPACVGTYACLEAQSNPNDCSAITEDCAVLPDGKELVPPGFVTTLSTGTERIVAIQENLMDQSLAKEIFRQIGQNPCDYKTVGFEDVHIILWARHLFRINECHDPCYPSFSIMPFATLQASLPAAKKKDRTQLFALPLGNDGHYALGGRVGFAIDFHETLEFGASGGATHFFATDFTNFRVPTSDTQSGIYPFATNVRRQPGLNTYFDIYVTAHHFICLLSMWVQYSITRHNHDKIKLLNPADVGIFKPDVLECVTKWESQMLNTGATYDISPNIALGLAVQWPISQRNAYRSTTILATLQAEF